MGGSHPKRFSVDNRNRGSNKALVVGPLDNYAAWKDRALSHLTQDRPDVRALLKWAEAKTSEITGDLLLQGGLLNKVPDPQIVNYCLFDGIKNIGGLYT